MANRYSIAALGAAEATACAPVHGQIHALLKNSKTLKYCVPNEFICAEIGRFMGLPIPPGGLCYLKGSDPEDWFASMNFNLLSAVLPPIDPALCAKEIPFESTGLILFDILIANDDRHRGNLNIDLSRSPPVMSVFDHSHALFGHVDGRGQERLRGNMDAFFIGDPRRHCLLDAISTDKFFQEWMARIEGLPNYLIDHACEATVPLGMISVTESVVAKQFLKHRKEKIKEIVKSNKKEFTKISDWSLV
ncbi:MAG: HipA family kinase [Limisphaerales bacterium]